MNYSVIDKDKIDSIIGEPDGIPRTAPPATPFTTNFGKGSKHDEGILLTDPYTANRDIRQNRFAQQSGWEVFGNMLGQTVGTVAGDIIGGVGALIDMPIATINEIFGYEQDMQNFITKIGEGISDKSREAFPVYTDEDKAFDFSSGAWWAKNVPNIASTISILIPAVGGVKALSLLGKGLQASKYTKIAKVGKALQLENKIARTSVLAANQRIIENYREGAQVYNDMLEEATTLLRDSEKFKEYMQKPEGQEAYQKALQNNYIEGDIIDKMAHHVASDASWKSFRVNSANFVFDYLQTAAYTKALTRGSRLGLTSNKSIAANAALFGETSGIKAAAPLAAGNKIVKPTVTAAQKSATKTAKAATKAAVISQIGRGKYVANAIRPYSDFILGASSEGVEEIINAIGQGEGMHYGRALLADTESSTFEERFKDYLRDPMTWEQGFWGTIGGGVFQAVGAAKTAYDKAKKKVGNQDEDKQLAEINGRKLQLINIGAVLQNLHRNLGPGNVPIVGTDEEIADQKQAIIEKIVAETGGTLGFNSARYGTADLLELMWQDKGLAKFIEDTAGEESHVPTQEIIDGLRQAATKAVQYYDKATSFFNKRTNKDYIADLITGEYVHDKSVSDVHANNATKFRKEYRDRLAKDAGYLELSKEPIDSDPANPTPKRDIDTELNNIAISTALDIVTEHVEIEALKYGVVGTENELLAYTKPVLDALQKQIVDIPNDQKLTEDEADTISVHTISALANAIISETLSNIFNSKAESIYKEKTVIPRMEKKVKAHDNALKDGQKTKFNTHLSTIASVNETTTIDEINSKINQIKEAQVNLSKGEVTAWDGNKALLTADAIKAMNLSAEALINRLNTLKNARREKNTKENLRNAKNTKALQDLRTAAADPNLEYDETVQHSATYGPNEYNDEVIKWVNEEPLPVLESHRGHPNFNQQLIAILKDSKQADTGVQKYLINRILEDFYGYESSIQHQANTKTDAAVNNALAELQRAMNNPTGIQTASFVSPVDAPNALKFNEKLATPAQISAATKLFTSIANALNKVFTPGKKTKLTFEEVLDYMYKRYGTNYMSNPEVHEMIQKAYLIISVSTDKQFSTTARSTVLNKFTVTKAVAQFGEMYDDVNDRAFIESAIITHTGGEHAANIFIADIQKRLLRNDSGDFVSPNATVSKTLEMLINDLEIGDTVVISVNTEHESFKDNDGKIKSVPIKIVATKNNNFVEIGYVNTTDVITHGGIIYKLDGTDYTDLVLTDNEIFNDIVGLIPALSEWLNYVVRNEDITQEDNTELETLTKELLDADTNNVLLTLLNLHGENNKIPLASVSPSLLHLARVLLYDGGTATNKINTPTSQDLRLHLQNWKDKLLRDKQNHTRIRHKIAGDITRTIETTISYKTKGNVVRSINPTTGEIIFRQLTDTVGTVNEIELFKIETDSGGKTLTNIDPRKTDRFNKDSAFNNTLYTQVASAEKDSSGNPIMIPVRVHNNTLDGSLLGKPTTRNTQTVDYVYNKLQEYIAVRRKINALPDGTNKEVLHKQADKLRDELHTITPVLNKETTHPNALNLLGGKFTFTANGNQVTYFFNREDDALYVNNKQVELTEKVVKELLGKLRTNVEFKHFEGDTFTDPVTGEVSSYKEHLLKHNIIITDIGMLLDEKGNKISNVTISNDNNRGGRPLMINVDTKNLTSGEIKTKAAFNDFVKAKNLDKRYAKFYKIIGQMIADKQLVFVGEGYVETNGWAQYNNVTKTLTLSTKWQELNSTQKSLILMHEFIHKLLKNDKINTKYHEELDAFRLSIVDSSEFQAINFDADVATLKMLTAKGENEGLTEEEKIAYNNAFVNVKVYKIFNNVYTDEQGNNHQGISAYDNEELVTYGLTDTDVAKFLNSIKSDVELKPGSETKWQEFKNIIREMIKEFVDSIKGATKLDELTALVDKIFEDVDSFIAKDDSSPVENENVSPDDIGISNKPNEETDFNPYDIELAVYASSSKDTPNSLSNRFKTSHANGVTKKYFLDKQDIVAARVKKINATLIKEGSNYRAKSVYLGGEPGDNRTYLGIQFAPTNAQIYTQYADFVSTLDLTKPITDLREAFNDYLAANPTETTDMVTPYVTVTSTKEGNSTMGFAHVNNFKDKDGNLVTTNATPFAYLGLSENNTFTLQLIHKEFNEETKNKYEPGTIANDYFTNWGKYTFPQMFDTLVKQGHKKIVLPKFMFDDDTNDTIHEFAIRMENNGIPVNYDGDNITFQVKDIQATQQAIFSSGEFLDNYSTKFTTSEEVAVTNLVSYLYRNLKNKVYKNNPPANTTIVKNDIIKIISHYQKERFSQYSADQIALQNRIIEDLKINTSDSWKMAVRDLRAKYNHNAENLDALLEDNDVNNKWEDNAYLFNNPNETMGDAIKDVLASLPLVDPATVRFDEKTNSVSYAQVNNSLTGFIESADYKILNAKLIEVMLGINNSAEMLHRLKTYGIDNQSSYGKTFLMLYTKLAENTNLRNAFYSYYSKRMTNRYVNLFRTNGDVLQHEQIIGNKVHGKYVLADEWRNTILSNFDMEVYTKEWDEAWMGKYKTFGDAYRKVTGTTLSLDLASQLSDLYEELGIIIDPSILQYYFRKGEGTIGFRDMFITPLNYLKSGTPNPKKLGYIDQKMLNPDIPFNEKDNLLRIAELVSYFTFGKGRFTSMNVKKNVVYTPANPHYLSTFMDKLHQEDDDAVRDFLYEFVKVPGSEHSYLLWGDEYNAVGQKITGKEGKGFLNYQIVNGKRTIYSLNKANIAKVNYAEFDGNQELNLGIPKEYADLSDSEWDITNLVSFFNSERKTPNNSDIVTMPFVIPSDSGIIDFITIPKTQISPIDNGTWFFIQTGFYDNNTDPNAVKFDNSAYYKPEYYNQPGAEMLKEAIESPIVQRYMAAYLAEIEEIKTAARVIFEIDNATGLPKRDANNKPILKKGIKGQLFYHYAKHDAVTNEPIYFDENGMPTGRGFQSQLFNYTNRTGKVVTLNDSKSIFRDGFISQYLDMTTDANKALLLFRIHNHMHEQYSKAQTKFAEYKDYVNKIVNKDQKHLLGAYSFEQAVGEMLFNTQLFNIEQQRFFIGSSANYKSNLDTTKRSKQITAPVTKSALTGTFIGVTISDVKLISSAINAKLEEAATAFKGLFAESYNANDIIAAANDKNLVNNLNNYEKAILDVIAPYFNNDSANAVSLITLSEYKKRLEGFGLTDAYADIIHKLENNQKLTPDDYSRMIQLQKNFYYSFKFNDALQKFVPTQVKNAEVVLTPSLAKGLQLEQLANFMEENDIAQINVESAEKVGTIGIARIHDELGNITNNFGEALLANRNTYHYESLGKQQDVPDHIMDAYNKLGVQVSKKIFDNIDFTQDYTTKGKKARTLNGEALIDKFFTHYVDNIVESSKKLLQRVITNHEQFEDIVSGKVKANIDYVKLKEILIEQAEMLGLSNNTILALFDNINSEGNVPLYYNVFYKKWQAILTSLFTNNVINQKHPGPHATQMSTLFLKPPIGKISNFAQKNVARRYSLRNKDKFAVGNIDWAKEIHERGDYRLRAQRSEDGKTLYAEVLLSRFSSQFIKAGRKYTIDQLNNIDPKLLTMVGYRIPTEDKHSMIVFNVVGFLPDDTAAIVLPDDFVTQSGADFDIDSLYMMMYNMERSHGNKLTIIDLDETNEKVLYNRYYKNAVRSFEGQAVLKQAGLFLDNFTNDITQTTYSEEELLRRPTKEIQKLLVDGNVFMTDYEFSKLTLSNKQELAATREGRENAMLDIMVAILDNPAHIVERNTPNGHDDLSRAKKLVDSVRGIDSETLDPSSYLGQSEFRSRNISTRNLKAFAVSRDGLLSIFQRVNAKVDNTVGDSSITPFTLIVAVNEEDITRNKEHISKLYPDATFETIEEIEYALIPLEFLGRNSSGKFNNIDNKLITSYSAQFTANILDGVKDELPRSVTAITLGWMETMVNLGATYNEIIAFYELPIMSKVIKGLEGKDNALKYKMNKSESILGAELFTDIYKTAHKEGLRITRKGLNGDYDIIVLLEGTDLIFPTFDEIDTLLKHYNKRSNTLPVLDTILSDLTNTTVDFNSKLRDLQYLSVHKYIAYVTTAIKENTTALGVDKIGAGPNFDKTKIIAQKLADPNQLIKSNGKAILSAIFDDFETSPYKPLYAYYHYGNKLAYDTFSPLFITENPIYNEQMDLLLSSLADGHTNPKRVEQVVTFLNKQLLHDLPFFNISDEEIKRIIGHGKFRGKTFKFNQKNAINSFNKLSLTRKIELMRGRYAKENIDLTQNILNYLTLESNSAQFERNKYERIQYIDNDIEEVLIASMTKLWLSDDEFERSLARDIVQYAYHVNGLSYSYSSLARVIPTSVISYEDDGNYEMSANKGVGISQKLRDAFETLSEIDEFTTSDQINLITSELFGTLSLTKKFLLSNYKDDNFIYNASTAIVVTDNGENIHIFNPDINNIISVPIGNIQKIARTNGSLDYIKLVDKNGEIQVYEQYQDEIGGDIIYYYPINKLEYYDRSFTSLIPSNNVDVSPALYSRLIESYINNAENAIADVSEGITISPNASTELGKALNKVHYAHNAKSPYDINPIDGVYGVAYDVNPATGEAWIYPSFKQISKFEAPSAYKYKSNETSAQMIWGLSVEAWYRANSNPTMNLEDRFKLLQALNHIKLLTYPDLYNGIKQNGGIEFLNKSKHHIGKVTRTDDWQGEGKDSNYILTLINAYNMIDGATIERKSIVDANPTINEIKPTVVKDTTIGFQGYKGGFENTGKGTKQGDGKDKAMRQVANGFIGEVIDKNSSSYTSALEIDNKIDPFDPIAYHDEDGTILSGAEVPTIVMLARNGKFKNKPLNSITKQEIRKAKEQGAKFVVGDMPGVDSQFIEYLQEIDATFEIYHTGNVPRIKINPKKDSGKSGEQLDLFNQQAEFTSNIGGASNQDLINAMTESGDLEIVCSGGATAANGMFIGSTTFGDWEIVSDLKGFPKHSAGGVNLTVGQDGSIDINDGNSSFKAKDGVFIPNAPDYEYMSTVLSQRNKNLNWVERGLNPDKYPSIKNQDGSISTHKLSYVTGDEGEAYVYPNIIQQEDGTLKELEDRAAWEYARDTKTAMRVPNVELAKYYSENGLINHKPGNPTNQKLLKSFGYGGTIKAKNGLITNEPNNDEDRMSSGPTIRGKQYPKGTIVTNDPNDPRLKAYQDSLYSYNTAIDVADGIATGIAKGYYNKKIKSPHYTKEEAQRHYKDNLKFYRRVLLNPVKNPSKAVLDFGNIANIKGDEYKYTDMFGYPVKGSVSNIMNEYSKWTDELLSDEGDDIAVSGMASTTREDILNQQAQLKKYKSINKNISPTNVVFNAELPPILAYKKPVQPVVYQPFISKMTPKGLPNSPELIPNERIMPDIIYKDNNIPNAAYNKGLDIYHRTDGLGRWAAQFIMSTKPGIRGRISAPNPKGNYTKNYKYNTLKSKTNE